MVDPSVNRLTISQVFFCQKISDIDRLLELQHSFLNVSGHLPANDCLYFAKVFVVLIVASDSSLFDIIRKSFFVILPNYKACIAVKRYKTNAKEECHNIFVPKPS